MGLSGDIPAGGGGERCGRHLEVLLHFDGTDTIGDIYLNGTLLGHVKNMHRIWEYSVKNRLRAEENELKVVLHSPTRFIREALSLIHI